MNLVTRKEASEILRKKVNTLYKWEKAGRLKPFIHISGHPLYSIPGLVEAATSNNFKQSKN